MNPDTTTAKAVLAEASFFDSRTPQPDRYLAEQWARALGPMDTDDAITAVIGHYRQPNVERIMPGDVIDRVRRIRAERVRAVDSSLLDPPDVDPADVEAWLTARRRRVNAIAAGQPVPAETRQPARDVTGLVEAAAAALPAIPLPRPRADLDKKRITLAEIERAATSAPHPSPAGPRPDLSGRAS